MCDDVTTTDFLDMTLREISDLELSIDYLKRRITFLKDLIRTKRTLMEIKE